MMNQADLRRSELLRGALVGGGVLLAGGGAVAGLSRLATAAPSAEQDTRILNLALLLEHLQLAFYTEALDRDAIGGELKTFAGVAREHEQVHVDTLRTLLGANAEDPPAFTFGSATREASEFSAAAGRIEDLSVAAYNGQAANLTPRARAQSARVASVDARHAAWVRTIEGLEPAAEPIDAGRTADQVTATLVDAGFVTEGTP